MIALLHDLCFRKYLHMFQFYDFFHEHFSSTSNLKLKPLSLGVWKTFGTNSLAHSKFTKNFFFYSAVLLPSTTVVAERLYFHKRLSFYPQGDVWQGGHTWQGTCIAKGHACWQSMRGREASWQGVYLAGGMCLAGGMHVWQGDPAIHGWYAYYWNAFLFFKKF